MKKVLITGITGFAGSHLAEHLHALGNYEISGIHSSDVPRNLEKIQAGIHLFKGDLSDGKKVEEILGKVQPEIIFHLAALTSVKYSYNNPLDVITRNIALEYNIFEGVKNNNLDKTLVVVTSSAHVYGYVSPKDLPITEELAFKPDNPYSVSKITQEYLAKQYFYAYKIPVLLLRPFNHIGPRLSPDISISRFAKYIAEAEKGSKPPVLTVGNLDAKRDFTDVRDMVRAYELAIEKCRQGEIYNIGTGVSYAIKDLLDILISLSKIKIDVQPDSSLFRPSDTPELRADATKFREATGWKPKIAIENSLKDTLDYWRSIV
jgi:GDP-4-dehydro-6-deoxy-D-mannose reductase